MIEKGNRIKVADGLRLVEEPGHPETICSLCLQDCRPFCSLQRYPIGPMKAGRDKSDTLGKMGLGRSNFHECLQLSFRVKMCR